jgi:hypothetical protein
VIDVALDVVALVLASVDGVVDAVIHVALYVVALVLASVDGRVDVGIDVALDVLIRLGVYVLLLHGDPPFELLELDH